jgi:hypothetical protein
VLSKSRLPSSNAFYKAACGAGYLVQFINIKAFLVIKNFLNLFITEFLFAVYNGFTNLKINYIAIRIYFYKY